MENQNLDILMKKYSKTIEKTLSKIVFNGVQIPNLHDGLSYALGLDDVPEKRGKRIRPVLCLMTTESLGGNVSQAIPFAVSIELMHNFFLIHDDIEDGDSFRRDRPCIHIKYGLPHGINIGDYMFTKVFQTLLEKTKPPLDNNIIIKLLNLIVNTLDHTHIGQAMDLNARKSKTFNIDNYFELVTEKTGYYLAAPIIGGAIIAKAPKLVIDSLEKYGKYVGPLFQIVDDLIDLTSGKGRKEIGSDIKEGKRSFLVAYVNGKLSKNNREKLFCILDKDRHKTTEEDIDWVIKLFIKNGAVEAGERMGEELLRKSKVALRNVPPILRERLIYMAEKMLYRKK